MTIPLVIILYNVMKCDKVYNIAKFFFKMANEKIDIRLRQLGISDDIRLYVLGLPAGDQPIAIGVLVKNRGAVVTDIERAIERHKRVGKLKEMSSGSIGAELPNIESNVLKNWITIQIKKNGVNKDLFIKNFDKIVKFLSNNDIDLFSFDMKGLLEYIDNVNGIINGKKEDKDDSINNFIGSAFKITIDKFVAVDDDELKNWVGRKLTEIKKEWFNGIKSEMSRYGKSFQQLVSDAQRIKVDMDAGLYRNGVMPNISLRNIRYDLLMTNLDFIIDWHRVTHYPLSSLSINSVIELSKRWHDDITAKGAGMEYGTINDRDIVWRSKDNEFIILELKTPNDLLVEGKKMSHCVGTYSERVKNGECRIFSLRSRDNIYEPILTIETDITGSIVRQDMGPGNTKINRKYHAMVDEWSLGLDIDSATLNKMLPHERDIIIERRLSALRRLPANELKKHINDKDKKIRDLVRYQLPITIELEKLDEQMRYDRYLGKVTEEGNEKDNEEYIEKNLHLDYLEEMEEMKYEQFDELAPENVIKQDIGNRYLRKHHRPPPRY